MDSEWREGREGGGEHKQVRPTFLHGTRPQLAEMVVVFLHRGQPLGGAPEPVSTDITQILLRYYPDITQILPKFHN